VLLISGGAVNRHPYYPTLFLERRTIENVDTPMSVAFKQWTIQRDARKGKFLYLGRRKYSKLRLQEGLSKDVKGNGLKGRLSRIIATESITVTSFVVHWTVIG
jgi:hypothetical protein